MFKDRLNLFDKQVLSKLLLKENYKAKNFNSLLDSKGQIHIEKEICAPISTQKLQVTDFWGFISGNYCTDCLNYLTGKEFALPLQALVSILRINLSLEKYNKQLEDYASDYDILTDLQHSLLSYKLYVEYHEADYLNSPYFYPLYKEYEKLSSELELGIKKAFSSQKETLRKIVTDLFFKEYQPGLWDFDKKFQGGILSSPTQRLNYQLAQEFYYSWVEQGLPQSSTDAVNFFLQNKLTESKLKLYQIADLQALRKGLITLSQAWVKEYQTLTSSSALVRIGISIDLASVEDTLVQSVILAYNFHNEKEKYLLELPKLVALWLREVFLSNPFEDNRRFCFDILPHHNYNEIVEGSKLWDPSGTGPLKHLESAIISAKLLNSKN